MRRRLEIRLVISSWSLCIAASLLCFAPLLVWSFVLLRHPSSVSFSYVSGLYFSLARNTFVLSFVAALIAVIFGTAIACIATSQTRRFRDCITIGMTIPLLMGFIVRNYAWVGLLSQFSREYRYGWISQISNLLLYRVAGVILVMAIVFTPLCYFLVLHGLDSLSPVSLQAARTLGATDARIFFAVVLPSIRRSQGLAFLASSVLAIGYFITPQLIGGGNFQFIGNGILTVLNDLGQPANASLLALMLLGTVVVVVLVVGRLPGAVRKVELLRNRRIALQKPTPGTGAVGPEAE